MKRLFVSFILLALPFGASASTDLARQWGQEANRLSVETADLMLAVDMGKEISISDAFALDVYRFGRTSSDLALWIDASNGPNDLGCIFRGMAAESEDQLGVLEETAETVETRESLRRLSTLFADAEMIAVAAQRRAPTPGLMIGRTKSSCAADASSVMDSLR